MIMGLSKPGYWRGVLLTINNFLALSDFQYQEVFLLQNPFHAEGVKTLRARDERRTRQGMRASSSSWRPSFSRRFLTLFRECGSNQ
jgi:hypothetical protein